jgi:RNA polymerase sigma factor (sigma-70 family)
MAMTDFTKWYREQHGSVAGVLFAICGNRQIAQDATDEAFTKAWQHWRKVSMMESPGGWVHKTALNCLRRTMRRRSIENQLLRRRRDVMTDNPASADNDLWNAVRRLPSQQRTALVLRYVGDMTEEQISETMGIARGTVAATLSTARHRLESQLRGAGNGQD